MTAASPIPPSPPSASSPAPTSSQPQEARQSLRAIRMLLPYLWPKGEPALRLRVAIALLFLLGAKLCNVYVPILYKRAVDALGPHVAGGAAVLAVPVGLIFAYGGARVLALAFGELRDAVFARVSQRAIRRVALRTFEHLHRLSLRFHL